MPKGKPRIGGSYPPQRTGPAKTTHKRFSNSVIGGKPDRGLSLTDLGARLAVYFIRMHEQFPHAVNINRLHKATGISRLTLRRCLVKQECILGIQRQDRIMRALGITARELYHEAELVPPAQKPEDQRVSSLEAKLNNMYSTASNLLIGIQAQTRQPHTHRLSVYVAKILRDIDAICIDFGIDTGIMR